MSESEFWLYLLVAALIGFGIGRVSKNNSPILYPNPPVYPPMYQIPPLNQQPLMNQPREISKICSSCNAMIDIRAVTCGKCNAAQQ